MSNVFAEKALKRLKDIHVLSQRVNKNVELSHQDKLLDMMRSHIDEIEMLFKKNDAHAIIETGDLLILCLELLVENNADCDQITQKCFERFESKLTSLINEI